MRWILLFFLLNFSLGCSTYQMRQRKNPCCAKLYDQLRVVWEYDTTQRIFSLNQSVAKEVGFTPIYFEVHFEDCFVGLSRESIIELFGNPNIEKDRELRYYRTAGCNIPSSNSCKYLAIRFDKDGEVVESISQSGWVSKN